MCKSAHQSFSHRVKSVTMSTWTLKEVRALSEKHGGGNKACIAKWLSSGDVEKYRPHPGDSLDKYKNFMPWWMPSKWTAMAADYCYGETIQSAVYKSQGHGNNSVEWSTELEKTGYYEISIWNP